MTHSQVGASLGFDVTEPAELVLRIAAARPLAETLTVTGGAGTVDVVELPGRLPSSGRPAAG